ncbi:oxidoreductase [Aureococcus anophagefferens]|nr:oxidoreductase [Aureococcus anophagefferens]
MADTDKSGRVTFDELDHMLDHILRIRSLSRYERRVFWARVDVDDSGEATYAEFVSLMYKVRLGTWPDLDDARCEAIIGVLDGAAEKWHRASGNWYKTGQHMRAKFPTSKAPISAIFHSFRLIFGRAIISRNGVEAYKIFRQFDRDASGEMSFEELCAVVRNRFPGVSLGPAQLPDEDLQGLWKRLDVDRSSTVSVQESS